MNGLPGLGLDFKSGGGGETNRAQEAQGVFLETVQGSGTCSLSESLIDQHDFNSLALSGMLLIAFASALVLACLLAARDMLAAARLPVIKLLTTKTAPELSLLPSHHWHLFLSHIWGSGQDQCATIKRQLTLLLPGASIFLDVDVRRSAARPPNRQSCS